MSDTTEAHEAFWSKKYRSLNQFEALAYLCRHWALEAGKQNPALTKLFDDATNSGGRNDNRTNRQNDNRASALREFVNRRSEKTDAERCHKLVKHLFEVDPVVIEDSDSHSIQRDKKKRLKRWKRAIEVSKSICDIPTIYAEIEAGKFDIESHIAARKAQSKKEAGAKFFQKEFGLKKANFNRDFKRFQPSGQKDNQFAVFACFRNATTKIGRVVRTRLILERPTDERPYTRFWNFALKDDEEFRNTQGIVLPLNGQSHFIGKTSHAEHGKYGTKVMILGSVNRNLVSSGLTLTRTLNNPLTIMSRVCCIREVNQNVELDEFGIPIPDREHLGVQSWKEAELWANGIVCHLPPLAKRRLTSDQELFKAQAEDIHRRSMNFPIHSVKQILDKSGLSEEDIFEIENLLLPAIKLSD